MSDTPQDPANNTIEQHQELDNTFEGQQGYDVNYNERRLEGAEVQEPPPAGRSGSYETNNEGGYGKVPPDPNARGTENNPRVTR